jgi:hypothetical protein
MKLKYRKKLIIRNNNPKKVQLPNLRIKTQKEPIKIQSLMERQEEILLTKSRDYYLK